MAWSPVRDAPYYSDERDVLRGGDESEAPSVRDVVEHYSENSYDDASNMNAGYFGPVGRDHAGHRNGAEIDGYFAGYERRNAATARKIIEQLNDDTYGCRILRVWVTHERVEGRPFYDAIRGVVLDDGRRATDVIRNEPKHGSHFHWNIAPGAPCG